MRLRIVHVLLVLACFAIQGCTAEMPIAVQDGEPSVRILQPMNPVSMKPTKHAPVIGLVFGGIQFPVIAKAENCEFLQVRTPWWGDVWIVGGPGWVDFEDGSCANLPDRSLYLEPQGSWRHPPGI